MSNSKNAASPAAPNRQYAWLESPVFLDFPAYEVALNRGQHANYGMSFKFDRNLNAVVVSTMPDQSPVALEAGIRDHDILIAAMNRFYSTSEPEHIANAIRCISGPLYLRFVRRNSFIGGIKHIRARTALQRWPLQLGTIEFSIAKGTKIVAPFIVGWSEQLSLVGTWGTLLSISLSALFLQNTEVLIVLCTSVVPFRSQMCCCICEHDCVIPELFLCF